MPSPHLHLTFCPELLKSASRASCFPVARWLLRILFLLGDSENTEIASFLIRIQYIYINI